MGQPLLGHPSLVPDASEVDRESLAQVHVPYNYKATRSAMLAFSTSMLQQLAVLGVIFIFLRCKSDEVNRGR